MEMIHLSYPLELKSPVQPITLAIGYFDGVHLGHRAVIEKATQMAEELGVAPGVMTFHPHPREVLGKSPVTRYLTPLSDKLQCFEELGVQKAYVMHFDHQFASLSKHQFVEEVLVPLQVQGITVGFNFTFGRGAEGNGEDLVLLGKGRFQVEVVRPVSGNGLSISSTRLRKMLHSGQVEEAGNILGRPYSLRGTVVSGDRRGRTIGYPTANLELQDPFIIPGTGVYIVRVQVNDQIHYGMMNIGFRPTFHDSEPQKTLEVHLFDVDKDLYGSLLKVEFLHFLRKEVAFPSVEALIHQLQADERNARSWLKRQSDA